MNVQRRYHAGKIITHFWMRLRLRVLSNRFLGNGNKNGDLEKIWKAAERTKPIFPPNTEYQWNLLSERITEQTVVPMSTSRRLVPRLAMALGIVSVISFGLYLLRSPNSLEIFETARGERSAIVLPDSSEVTLSHTSTLQFDQKLFAQSRHLKISGEAYFRVRKTGSPFVVRTDLTTITVLGTEFNIRVRGDEYEVGVIEGIVSVTSGVDKDSSTTIVAKGKILSGSRYSLPGPPLSIAFTGYPGWTSNKFLFSRATVLSVCAEIQDRLDVRIRIDDPSLGEMAISGILEGRDAHTVLSSLSVLTGRKLRYANDTYILY